MKKLFLLLGCLAIVCLFIGCAANPGSSGQSGSQQAESQQTESQPEVETEAAVPPTEWHTPYDETVVLTFARSGNLESPKFPTGDDVSDNAYTRWILERFNLKVENAWMTDVEYTQKVALAIASRDIPDVMMIYDRIQLIQMIEGGLTADVTDALNEKSSPLLKSIHQAHGGLDRVTIDCKDSKGRIKALPGIEPLQYNLTWIRTDWLDELGLAVPKTMDELIDAARAFVENDMAGDGNTVGISLGKQVAPPHPNNANLASPIFGYFDAYPRVWHKASDGGYMYGTLSDETREALIYMASLYKEGLISPEFATADEWQVIAANYPGIFFGAWWTGAWPLADGKANDPSIEWIPIWITDKNGKYNVFPPNIVTAWGVVRNDYEHPEAPVILMNLSADQQNLFRDMEFDEFVSDIPSEVDTAYKNLEWKIDWGAWPLPLIQRYPDQMVRLEKVWNTLIARRDAGESIPEFSTESFDADLIISYRDGHDQSSQGFHVYTKTLGLTLLAENESGTLSIKDVVYPPMTDEFEMYWTNLLDMEDLMFLKIVMGQEPIEYFDEFKAQWLAQGGSDLTKVVNDLYK